MASWSEDGDRVPDVNVRVSDVERVGSIPRDEEPL